MIKELLAFLPGWIFLYLIGLLAAFISSLVSLGGKHVLEASALAVVLGLVLSNYVKLPSILQPGIKAGEKPLVLGIVFMGAGLNLANFLSQGSGVLVVIAVTMLAGYLVVLSLGRQFGLSKQLSLLLASGTSICGGTAIAVIAPIIKAPEEDTAYAVATIALWGVLAILIYPMLGSLLNVSDLQFGVFAGTAIHSTPQVVGAGFIFSSAAGNIATAVKLVRNCFLAPLALLLALIYRSPASAGSSFKMDFLRAFPWFLFGYFVLSWMATRSIISSAQAEQLVEMGKILIVMGMVAVGLNTNLAAIRQAGVKPLFVGLIGAVAVAATSIVCIRILV